MRQLLWSLLVSAILAVPCLAEVKIDKKNQVENFGPGYCAWCCIETLGRHHNVKELFDLAKNRSKESHVKQWDSDKGKWIPLPKVMVEHGNGVWVQEDRNVGSDWGIFRKMNALGIKYYMCPTGSSDCIKLIKYAMKHDLGCCFAVKKGCFGKDSSPHAMILTDFNDKEVRYIDPNHIGKVFVKSREWFDKWNMKWILVVVPPKK